MTNTGTAHHMQFVGRGLFTRAYRCTVTKKVFLRSKCHVKEIMALGWFPDSKLFPRVERTSLPKYDYVMKDYSSDKYKLRVAALCKSHRRLYDALRTVDNIGWSNPELGFSHLQTVFDNLDILPKHKIVLSAALGALSNYGTDIYTDVSRCNLRQAGDKLILLDIFLLRSQWDEVMQSRAKRRARKEIY
jgi:hypothetical protein